MAEIQVKRGHALAQQEAKRAVEDVADRLKADLGARYWWAGNQLQFECPGAKGRIDVKETEIIVSVSLSWLLSAARGKIEQAIGDYLDRTLS